MLVSDGRLVGPCVREKKGLHDSASMRQPGFDNAPSVACGATFWNPLSSEGSALPGVLARPDLGEDIDCVRPTHAQGGLQGGILTTQEGVGRFLFADG